MASPTSPRLKGYLVKQGQPLGNYAEFIGLATSQLYKWSPWGAGWRFWLHALPSIALHRVIKAAAPKKVFPSAQPPPGRGRVCESDTRQMDLNGDFPAGADVVSTGAGGRARAFRHALKRQRRTTLAPCGGGDRANFQLQSISMTPDGRAGRTDGRD